MSNDFEENMIKMKRAELAICLKEKDWTLVEKVRVLKRVGIGYKEIADILGSTPNHISVLFAKINKEEKE